MTAMLEGHRDSARSITLSLDNIRVPGLFGQDTASWIHTVPTCQSQLPPHLVSISHDHDWILGTHGDCWLPARYRNISTFSFSGSRAIFGYPDGNVIILDTTVVPSMQHPF